MSVVGRRTAIAVTAVALLAVTAIAGYCVHHVRILSIPIPKILAGFTLGLPIVTGVAVPTLLAKRDSVSAAFWARVLLLVLVIYETVVASLAGTYLFPKSSLSCGLDERWLDMFKQKDVSSIKTIQDWFNCCGLHSVHDKAWPFPDKEHGTDACTQAFGRRTPCFEAWRGEEQMIAGWMLVVAVAVFAWKGVVLLLIDLRSSARNLSFGRRGYGPMETEPSAPYRDDEDTIPPSRSIADASRRAILERAEQPESADPESNVDTNEWARN